MDMATDVSRRDFLKGAGIAALGVASVSALSACDGSGSAASAAGNGDKSVDVLVVGAGIGGLISAASAAETGASVLVIDASTRAGSTALMCSGFMTTHGSNSVEELRKNAPLTDPTLGQAFLDAWQPLLDWLGNIGAPLAESERKTVTGSYPIYQLGGEPAPGGNIAFASFLEEYAKGQGVEILYRTKAKRLVTGDTGAVEGVVALGGDGAAYKIAAKQVVLACGGTQNNKEMNVKYISPYADLMVSRGNPHDAGSGLMMAQEVGAVPSRSHGTFYGHPVPFGVEVTENRAQWDEDILDDGWIADANAIFTVAQNSGAQYGIVVNLEGKRFFDESQDDLLLNQAIARQRFARAFEVVDARIREAHTGTSPTTGTEYLDLLAEWGGTLFQAETIDELGDVLANEGVVKANLINTIEKYNAAVDDGSVASLEIPKSDETKAEKVETGPFYAFAVVPGYSFSFGGVKVNAEGRVVDADDDSIAGLWAVLGTAGGMQYDTYIGVISTMAAMGRATGLNAGSAAAQANS